MTSAPAGSGVVLVLTPEGVVLVPVMLILTMLAIFAGHALGSCVPGVCLWLAIGTLAAFAPCRGWLQRREAVQP